MRHALLALVLIGVAGPALAEEHLITSAESFVNSPTLSAPITAQYAYAGLLTVDLGFDVPDPKLRARVNTLQPKLTDAMRSALADYTYARFRPGGAPDPDRIEVMLQQAADRTLGGPGAKVLLANVMVQRGK